jgi:hypothetical protein
MADTVQMFGKCYSTDLYEGFNAGKVAFPLVNRFVTK